MDLHMGKKKPQLHLLPFLSFLVHSEVFFECSNYDLCEKDATLMCYTIKDEHVVTLSLFLSTLGQRLSKLQEKILVLQEYSGFRVLDFV